MKGKQLTLFSDKEIKDMKEVPV
jgi:hypothetical protein